MSAWTPPRGLDVPAPRKAAMDGTVKGLILFFFALFTIPLLTIVPSELSRARKLTALREHGIEVAAEVDREDERRSKQWTSYIAAYHYRVDRPGGMAESPFFGEGRMSWNEYVKISVGGKIPVVYDERSPGLSTTKTQLSEDGASPYKVLLVLLPVFIGAPIVITAYSFLTSIQQKRLLRWGNVAHAKIISEAGYTSLSGANFCEVTYEFKDSSGAKVTGTRKGVPAADNDRQVMLERRLLFLMNPTAIYDPQNSERNMLYPPSGATLL